MLIQLSVPLNSPETLSGVLTPLLIFHILYRHTTLFNTDVTVNTEQKEGQVSLTNFMRLQKGDSQMRMKLLGH